MSSCLDGQPSLYVTSNPAQTQPGRAFVRRKEYWRLTEVGKATVGLASLWPCVTGTAACRPTDSNGLRQRLAPRLRSFVNTLPALLLLRCSGRSGLVAVYQARN